MIPRGSKGGSGKPSKIGTSAKLFCNSLLGLLTNDAVRIGGMLVCSGGQITSSSSPDSKASYGLDLFCAV